MMSIEQLRKDMEAGTRGDWGITTVTTIWKGGHQSFMDEVPESTPYIISALHEGVCDIDARRIARVPQLERIALAAEELADKVAADSENRNQLSASVAVALAAYREATK